MCLRPLPPFRPKTLSGFSMVSALLALTIVSMGFLGLGTVQKNLNRLQRNALEQNLASTYAIELMEVFQSHSGTTLLNYLASMTYPLCAHINIADRSNATTGTVLLNPDPNIQLFTSQLDVAGDNVRIANRYYFVQVVDISAATPTVVASRCGLTPGTGYVAGNANERLQVTVGVSWVPSNRETNAPKKVTVKSILGGW